ncbi:ABC transporter permease [Bifidobacterium oedipodis]|uniref:ABC transporter substrate-binding protein n=1 Tax=Bifidobacterium oedipodis TaxID=2675322 RepID=A0A7Y0EMJ0_9BIFI|nr:FtsX-like permease family protein [Bifidobacterium sp. DSM 109957]NMM92917.1 ABC transporter substrate-binding protein [Bifidobacterium sp. DSM 109957]
MFHMIVSDLRISPLRTVLTSLSMFIGIITLILSVLIGTLGKSYLESTNAQLSGWSPTYTVTVSDAQITDLKLNEKMIETMQENPIGIIVPEYQMDSLGIYSSGSIRHVNAVVTSSQRTKLFPVAIVKGQWFAEDSHESSLQVVVNREAEGMILSDGTVDLGVVNGTEKINIWVRGVIDDGSSEPIIYLDALTMERFLPQMWRPEGLTVFFHPTGSVNENMAKSAVSDLLFDSVGGKIGSWNRSDNAESYESVIDFLQTATLVSALLLLVVSAIGLINIGMAGIEQRSRELLIRRAIGATKTSIVCLVIGSSMLLSLIIACISIGISILLVAALPYMMPSDVPLELPPYPYSAAVLACVSAVVTACIGSIAPAIRASALQPALVLR